MPKDCPDHGLGNDLGSLSNGLGNGLGSLSNGFGNGVGNGLGNGLGSISNSFRNGSGYLLPSQEGRHRTESADDADQMRRPCASASDLLLRQWSRQ